MNKKLSLFLLIISVGLLTALAAGSVFAGGEDGLKKADEARQKHTAALLAKPGVVAVAVGFNSAGEAAVKVYTEDAKVKGVPTKLDGVPVHKQVSGKIMALRPGAAPGLAASAVDTTARFPRPVPIGVSTGHPAITAGTIGARVTDGANVYALSNNHIYADENNASTGDAVIQPGAFDGGNSPADDIGTLADFEPIIFGNFGKCLMQGRDCNYMDAAVALTSTDNVGNSTPDGGYGTPHSSVVVATVGMSVQKYGRTTGLQSGTVDSINAAVRVGYSSGSATYRDQIIITPGTFSAGGDSGSLVVTNDVDNNPVGLLFAGSGTTTIASPIHYVLDRFSVTIDNSASTPDTTAPIISNVAASNITATSADITWTTDEAADSRADYGPNTSYGSFETDAVMVASHSINLTGLEASSTFHYMATSADTSGNSASSVDFTFTTAAADTTAPVISNVAASNITATSADITWTTDEAADSRADYGPDTSYGSFETDAVMVSSHSINLTGLEASSTYHYMATSADGSGNWASSVDFTFTTAAAPETPTSVSVDSVSYATEGGKNKDKHLNITVVLVDDLGNPVSGASVSMDLKRDGSTIASGTGTTGTSGKVAWTLNNAASGCYSTDVTDVTADGLTWDDATPANSFAHKATCS